MFDDITERKQAEAALQQAHEELKRSQRRARAVRLRRLARPAGAAAHGGELHPAARPALRGQARPGRARVHGLHRRRRDAHEAADRGPARLLARRHQGRGVQAGRAAEAALRRALVQPARGDRGERRRGDLRPAADAAGRRGAARAAVPEPDRQRAQVPLGASCRGSTFDQPRRTDEWQIRSARQRHRHRAAVLRAHLHGVPAPAQQGRVPGHRHRPGHLQEGGRAPRRPHLGRVDAGRGQRASIFTLPKTQEEGAMVR